MNIQVGDTVPIELQITNGAIDQYPRALVYSEASALLITIDLVHDNQGNYSGNTYVMPNNEFIKVIYIVYSDSGHTTLNTDYERDLEIFYRILPDDFKADTSLLAIETTAQLIWGDTNELQINQGDWLTATGFSVPNEYNVPLATIQADLDNPDQYKANVALLALETTSQTILADTNELQLNQSNWLTASGFSIPNEYDTILATIQADLDNPNQYKADVALLAIETTSQTILADTNELQLNQSNWLTATGFSVPNEYVLLLTNIQADLDTPDQYKATGFSIPGEYDASLSTVQETINRVLGLTQENQYIDTTVYAGKNLLSARLRIYSDSVSVGTDLNVIATYTIIGTYTVAGMQTYSMVKV